MTFAFGVLVSQLGIMVVTAAPLADDTFTAFVLGKFQMTFS
jgi:hypothetical protein